MSETETKVKPDLIPDEPKSNPVETTAQPERKRTESERSEGSESNPDIHFDPIISLPLIDLKTLEENETEIIKLRAKIYRYDTSEDQPQFKERGTGELKLLKHSEHRAVRLVMRRDKTLKLCANHYIMPSMELRNHMGNEKVFVWSTYADLCEDTPKPETLAIRFGSVENATKFKEAFEAAKIMNQELPDLSQDLSHININDQQNDDSDDSDDSDLANGSQNKDNDQKSEDKPEKSKE